jgi:hypothetical protein
VTRASIWQTDDAVGFHWLSASGVAATLSDVVAEPDSEPHRLLPTHLEAVDDVLIDAVGRWGDILGGGRRPTADEADDLAELHQVLDRLCLEYADALKAVGATADVRAGQIIGTAALVSRRARAATGTAGPQPLSDELDEPPVGVVSGFADLVLVDPDRPGLGARWVVRTETGLRLPANLHMLLHDSSGVFKDAALDEHRAALRDVLGAEGSTGPDTWTWAMSLEWLLDDFLLAHRESPSSAAVTLRPGRRDDAQLIVSAAAAVTRSRLPPNS